MFVILLHILIVIPLRKACGNSLTSEANAVISPQIEMKWKVAQHANKELNCRNSR